jgi:hypothetical protein
MVQSSETTYDRTDGTAALPSSFLPFKYGRIVRKMTISGAILVFIGIAAATSPSGVMFLLLGLALVVATTALRIHYRSLRRQDQVAARGLAETLRQGRRPTPVDAVALQERGQTLESGENCYLDQQKAECLQWYGEAIARQRRLFLACGSPLAWVLSITATLMFWSHDRKQAKAAAPAWRDPEPANVWVTDRRFIIHGESGNRSWVQIRWEHISRMWLESDGVVLILDGFPAMKLRMGPAAWTFVAVNYFGWGRIVESEYTR